MTTEFQLRAKCHLFSSFDSIHCTDASVLRANQLIQKLYQASILSSVETEKAKQEYQTFLNSVAVASKEKLLSFDKDVDRLDR